MKHFLTIVLLVMCAHFAFCQVETAEPMYDSVEYEYCATNRNPLYLFGSPFSSHFAEIKYMGTIKEFGAGVTYTYLPEVTGWNVYGAWSPSSYWLGGGMSYRLSKPWSIQDWHTYANVGIRNIVDPGIGTGVRPTLEMGLRWAKGEDVSGFSFSSGSLSLLTDFHQMYITINFGLLIGILASAGILMAQY